MSGNAFLGQVLGICVIWESNPYGDSVGWGGVTETGRKHSWGSSSGSVTCDFKNFPMTNEDKIL